VSEDRAWVVDTRPRREGCSAVSLVAAVANLYGRYPTARLIRNQVGNLSAVVDGDPVGYLDLTFGRFVDFADEE
jgi:hypothetical protein